jgi:serine/threonine-protein kinase
MARVPRNGIAERDALERVLSSPGFARSGGLSRLLRHLIERQLEGRENDLKESLIGVEVYGRKPDYDPKLDSTVRSEIARLRARLAEYYANEGRTDAFVIEVPKGGYVPRFRRVESAVRPAWRWLAVALAGGGALAAAGFWFHGQKPTIPLAVLPFANLSPDPEDRYLADGLTDELIRNLSILDGLTVRSQTSSFTFKGKPRNVRDAGKELEADYILEGSVLRSGQQLRVNTQLVRARDDSPVWSGRFEREVVDVVRIQDEISLGIVNSLRLKLGRGRRRYETNAEAYDLYLRARASATQRFPGDQVVIGLFEKAVAKDPSLAPAYAGLAGAYVWWSFQNPNRRDHDEKLVKMRSAAEKAIELDPLLAEAHSALGAAYARVGQWSLAEQSLRRAIEIEPNLAMAHDNLTWFFLFPLGRIEEAIREARNEVTLDPLSPVAHYLLAETLLSAGRYDEAANHCEKLPTDFLFTGACLGRAQLGRSRTAEALKALAATDSWGYLAYAYGTTGRRDELDRLLAEARKPQGHFQYALVYAGMKDKDRTIDQLERWAGVGPVRMGFALTSPEFAFLQGDPRVKALRKRVGLPE